MSYLVTLLDPRRDGEPVWWESWRRRADLWANWAWPVLRSGTWTSRSALLLAVIWRDGAGEGTGAAGVVAATVSSPFVGRSLCPAAGWPTPGYLHVQAPQSSAQPGWWFDTDDRAERAAMFRAYVRAVRRELRGSAVAVLWRQVGEADLGLIPRPIRTRPTEPVAVLETIGTDRAGWLAMLRRSRRNDLKRIFRSVETDPELEVRIGTAAEVVGAGELVRLARLNYDKHGVAAADRRTGLRTVAWHQALLDCPQIAAIAYRNRSGHLLGAGLVLEDARRPLWLSWGAEPVERGGRKGLYFDLFGQIVDRVVAQGRQGIVLGKGMAELKADLGARLVPQYAVVSV